MSVRLPTDAEFASSVDFQVPPAVPLPHTVTESGPEQWRLRIKTTNCDCTFVPYFTWSSDGNAGTFDIPDGSKPWQVAAVTRAHPAFRGANGRWTPS